MNIKRNFLKLVFGGFIFLFCSCEKYDSSKLEQIIDRYENYEAYDKEKYPLGIFTKEHYASVAQFSEDLLLELDKLDFKNLSETQQISAQLLKFLLEDQIDYFKEERFLNPLLSDSGFHLTLNFIVQPLNSYNSVKSYLKKLEAIPTFVDQHFANLREGIENGVSQPKVIFKGYESTYDKHIVEDFKESYFYKPLEQLPSNLQPHQRDSVLDVAEQLISNIVVPQFKRVKRFFEEEYYQKTRTTIGVSETPGGADYYQNRINYYTTSTAYTADKIHDIGLKEVARIRKEMKEIIKALEFEGSFQEILEFLRTDDQFYVQKPESLLRIARDISKRLDEQLPKYFKTLPRMPYGVAPVPEAIAPKYTTGRYVGTSKNSTRPGYYWVNTYNLKSRKLYTLPALTAHEAVPGHHLQGALNLELGDSIPQFRKNLYLSAFGEGWGLYSEFLANEMGIYTTPYEVFGQLTYEMWRACRLVVDTGIHAKSWTREQVVRYLSENTALSLHEINTETDRYISWPGQAISYKIGEIKIRELRQKAELELADAFDIRAFHEVILEQGTVTLSILEDRIHQYIEKSR